MHYYDALVLGPNVAYLRIQYARWKADEAEGPYNSSRTMLASQLPSTSIGH